ncbi:hypothetical protein SNEBB_006593 [Seison nebaliae]|nr:hypothetical protein SNEBB_006593 [Seison nebaliae]
MTIASDYEICEETVDSDSIDQDSLTILTSHRRPRSHRWRNLSAESRGKRNHRQTSKKTVRSVSAYLPSGQQRKGNENQNSRVRDKNDDNPHLLFVHQKNENANTPPSEAEDVCGLQNIIMLNFKANEKFLTTKGNCTIPEMDEVENIRKAGEMTQGGEKVFGGEQEVLKNDYNSLKKKYERISNGHITKSYAKKLHIMFEIEKLKVFVEMRKSECARLRGKARFYQRIMADNQLMKERYLDTLKKLCENIHKADEHINRLPDHTTTENNAKSEICQYRTELISTKEMVEQELNLEQKLREEKVEAQFQLLKDMMSEFHVETTKAYKRIARLNGRLLSNNENDSGKGEKDDD